MRGAPRRCAVLRPRDGIIPAYAGSTRGRRARRTRRRDHPRVCGEHFTRFSAQLTSSGSSPRMRGAPVKHVPVRKLWGIIPAYAGSTSSAGIGASMSRDHPRVCGEHYAEEFVGRYAEGSSPRMRGALSPAVPIIRWDGIIPAYAGSTSAPLGGPTTCRDHPRVCGEHDALLWLRFATSGSSPRMRGARQGERAGP